MGVGAGAVTAAAVMLGAAVTNADACLPKSSAPVALILLLSER